MKDYHYIIYSKIAPIEFDAGSEFKLYHILQTFRNLGFLTNKINNKWIISTEDIKIIEGSD